MEVVGREEVKLSRGTCRGRKQASDRHSPSGDHGGMDLLGQGMEVSKQQARRLQTFVMIVRIESTSTKIFPIISIISGVGGTSV